MCTHEIARGIPELTTSNTLSYIPHSKDYDLRPAKALYSHFEASHGCQVLNDSSRLCCIVNENAGVTVGVYNTKLEAQQKLQIINDTTPAVETALAAQHRFGNPMMLILGLCRLDNRF
jgi:hypothetical protein